ncbi:hypothetical protein AOB54_08035 [beta proteobacterium MWH-UniP1]
MGKTLDDWLPTQPLRWTAAFAALYVGLYHLNLLIAPFFDVVPGRVSLLFLPAFIRVAAILIAGLAGLAGVVIGSLWISLVVYQEPLVTAVWVSIASSIGIALSYLVLRYAYNGKALAFSLPVLMVLATLYCAFNALLHGLAWELLGLASTITMRDLALMMIGDFMGVIVMFSVLRLVLRAAKKLGFHTAIGR